MFSVHIIKVQQSFDYNSWLMEIESRITPIQCHPAYDSEHICTVFDNLSFDVSNATKMMINYNYKLHFGSMDYLRSLWTSYRKSKYLQGFEDGISETDFLVDQGLHSDKKILSSLICKIE